MLPNALMYALIAFALLSLFPFILGRVLNFPAWFQYTGLAVFTAIVIFFLAYGIAHPELRAPYPTPQPDVEVEIGA